MLLLVPFDTNRVADTNKNTNSSRRWTKCDDLFGNAPKFANHFQKPWINRPLREFQRTRLGGRECREKGKWCPGAESNHRHADFQSAALPTELPGPIVCGRSNWYPDLQRPCAAARKRVGYSMRIAAVQPSGKEFRTMHQTGVCGPSEASLSGSSSSSRTGMA